MLSIVAAPALADRGDPAAYMKARAAEADGRVADAAAGYARALAAAPGDTDAALHAYRQALAAGDDALVGRAAAALRGTPAAPADLALVALTAAARADDVKAFQASVVMLDGTMLKILSPSLRGWAAFAAGADPLPALSADAKSDPIATRLAEETRALLAITRGDTAGGLALVATLRAGGAPIDLRLAAAQLLFGAGRDGKAAALLTGDDATVVAMRAARSPARPTLAFGTSRLLTRIAGDLIGNGPAELSIALTRAALRADPGDDRARLLLADALSRSGASGRALAVLEEIKPTSPFAAAAAAGRVAVLTAAGRTGEALTIARTRADRAASTAADWQRYADLLVAANRFGEAAPWYRRIVEAAGGDGDGDGDWAAWLQYGGALDRAGDWPAAREALAKAAALAPAEPLALNYLGYARAEHGEQLPAATAMLERAHALKPDDGSITDSLGWAYHLGGDDRRALPLIEQAGEGDAANAEIGEHLGDVYWRLGRRYEARYAWRAAALTADPIAAARLAEKLTTGSR